jgi:uncharacterized protein YegP (UPF0339 family)
MGCGRGLDLVAGLAWYGEAYESQASAIKGIESVKRNAPTAEIDDQTDK